MWKYMTKYSVFLMALSLSMATAQDGSAIENPDRHNTHDWQMKQINHPGKGQLKRERLGQVTIYDRFTDRQVEQILDQHFSRIENMMFTRIRRTDSQGQVQRNPQTGEEVVEDDGCDE